VAISHLKPVTEHLCIQPYAEHAGILQYFFLSENSLNNVFVHSRWRLALACWLQAGGRRYDVMPSPV